MVHLGKDFASREVVESYDAQHRQFRDIEGENNAIIQGLDLQKNQIIADFGSGTGAFALQAAPRCAMVYAVDISRAMLDYVKCKAQSRGLINISFHQAGFLTYIHTDAPLDAITSSMALHHLPDFWKQKALDRLCGMLKKGGRLFLADVVFSEENYETNISEWVKKLTCQVERVMVKNIISHIRQEHSTFTWIMEGLIERAGFRIDRVEYSEGVLAKYYGTKIR
jgi:ubiquinone/menaquinone biosynthesis C-methylase UbiE